MIKKFSIPGYYKKFPQVVKLVEYTKQFPEQFYPDRILDSSYDANDETTVWQGGRGWIPVKFTPMEIVLQMLPDLKLRHTFTNCLITEDLLKDYRCNYFLQNYVRPQDEVIAASPLLIDYLNKNYPEIKVIYSTTMNITDIDKINEITKNNIYVLNYNCNNNNNYLKQLKHLNNIEVLCGEPCIPNCPNRALHYEVISKKYLGIKDERIRQIEDFCPRPRTPYTEFIKLPHAVTNERIEELSSMGIQYFKISGRLIKVPDWLGIILYYIALPEWREYIYAKLLNEWW